MFLDILEFKVKNKPKYLEKKTVMVIWPKTCGKMDKIACKVTMKKIVYKIWTFMG